MDEFDAHERRTWAGKAEAYSTTFAKLCVHAVPELLDVTGVDAWHEVLDVGCGSGAVSRAVLERGAAVTAVDAEKSMVDLTRRLLPKADVCLGALPHLPFADASFDTVLANFVLNHVADPAAALSELRRVLRPGGRIGVTIWPGQASSPFQLWARVIEAAEVVPVATARLEADKDFPRTETGLSQLIAAGEFKDVESQSLEWEHRVDAEVWWSGPASGLANIGRLVTAQSPETATRMKQQFDRLSAQYRGENGELVFPTVALLATAVAE